MAWIEAHQQLRDHPKITRLGRLLDVPRTSATGHMMFLWWWALDHAEDGDLSDYDALDIADAAGFEGDAETFVDALLACGPGDRHGFVCRNDGRLVLHDWWDYAGKLVDRRVKDRERKRAQRESSNGRPADVHRTSADIARRPIGTQHNTTEPLPMTTDESVVAPNAAEQEFEDTFWPTYPRGRAGKPGGDGSKAKAKAKWLRMTNDQRAIALVAVANYADYLQRSSDAPHAAHATTWLNEERWDTWAEPAVIDAAREREERRKRSVGTGGVA